MQRDVPQTRDAPRDQSLEGVFHDIGKTAIVATLVVAFGVPLVILTTQVEPTPTGMWWTLAGPLLLALPALGVIRVPQRILLANAAGLALLLLQVIVDQPYGPSWFPYTFAVFAVSFGAAFSLPTVPGLAAILTAAVLNFIAVTWPTRQMLLGASDLAGGLVGPGLAILVCGGFAMVTRSWRQTASSSDARTRALEVAIADAFHTQQLELARTGVQRRIHETVLNTLNVVARGWFVDPDVLRDECRRDLEQLNMNIAAMMAKEAQTVEETVESAWAVVLPPGIEFRSAIHCDALIAPITASALRDALVEVFRNIERHSQASVCSIEARLSDGVVRLEVSDNGVGLADGASERFGLRNTIRGSIESVGGAVVLGQQTGEGVTVRINVPVSEPAELQIPNEPALDLLLRPVTTRVFLLGGAAFGLLFMPWLAAPFTTDSTRYVLALFTFIAANVSLALVWNSKFRMAAAFIVIVASVFLFVTLLDSPAGCQAAPSIHWTINSAVSCLSLLLFASFGRPWSMLVVPTVTGMGLLVLLSLPDECRSLMVMPLVSTTTYLVAALYLIHVILTASDRQQRRDQELWSQAIAKQAETARRKEASEQWGRVSAGTKVLLGGLAYGSLDPNSPDVRRRAAHEEAALRARLETSRHPESAIWQDLLTVASQAASAGAYVDVAAIEVPEQDRHLPDLVLRMLRRIAVSVSGNPTTIRLSVINGIPEIVCTCPMEVARAAWHADIEDPGATAGVLLADVGDKTTLILDPMEGGLACLSVRQEP